MPTPLDSVKTIVVLMQENRSFDHMLGYLSLPPFNRANVDGLRNDPAWRKQYANPDPASGKLHEPFHLGNPAKKLPADPKHDRVHIAAQLGAAQPPFPMTGFVQSCPNVDPATGNPMVMGYFEAEDLPTTHFFAQEYAICDHWFCSIPTGTQPNRLMAFGGASRIADNAFPLPSQPLVYDWLENRGIRWRVYHHGLPFFAMMPDWVPFIGMPYSFRHISWLIDDVQNESDDKFPQVIFIDPLFTDAPHIHTPNDDHAPAAITGGQTLMADIYATLASNPNRWAGTVFVVTYDEAGGFFDHVAPPESVTRDPAGHYSPFTTLGPRVPGFVISPLVERGAVYNGVLDHTSILKFIADKFAPGQGYSPEVDTRRFGPPGGLKDINSLTSVLTRMTPRSAIPQPDTVSIGFSPGTVATEMSPKGFEQALHDLRQWDKDAARDKFPELNNF